ncbi:MAG: hypothetical protein ACRCYU_24005 [Nocardioides sp.]
MTTHEQFKKRVRARMAKTGEKYAAARRTLLPTRTSGRAWVSQPEMNDEAIRRGTGRGWNEWCDLIDAWPESIAGHAAVAAWIQREFGLTGWYAQGVTVGWERITGRRVPGQMHDGTFGVSRSKVISRGLASLRALLLNDADREELLGMPSTLRSKPTSKALRFRLDQGDAVFSFVDRPDGKTGVTVSHEKLPDTAAIAVWREYWADWLSAMAAADDGVT